MNRFVILILVSLLGSLPLLVEAQPTNWEQMEFGSHTPWIPRFMHYSESLGMTVYGGYFFNEENESYLAGYDGENWTSISDNVDAFIFSAVEYDTGIMISGFGNLGEESFNGVANYDGDEWNFAHRPFLSIDDLSKQQIAFDLFPNPARSHITIQSEAQLDRLTILDVSGRVVLLEKAFPKNGQVDIGNLPSGIYLVRVESSDGLGLRKLVVE